MSVRTYNPKDFILTVGGVPISGFIDGDAVQFEFDEDSFSKSTGLDGSVARVRTNNDSGQFTVTLQGTSPSNDYLSALANQDRKSATGVREVLLKQLNGTTTVFAQSGWVMKPPSLTVGKDLPEMEWVLDCSGVEFNYGSVRPL